MRSGISERKILNAHLRITYHHHVPFTVSGKYFVLSGQHRVEAARRVAEDAARHARQVPVWATTFRCRVVKQGTTKEQRELVAGRSQARDSNVLDMAMSERVRWLARELALDKERHEEVQRQRQEDGQPVEVYVPNKQFAMRETYNKTGCKERTEGSVVCFTAALRCGIHLTVPVLVSCMSVAIVVLENNREQCILLRVCST